MEWNSIRDLVIAIAALIGMLLSMYNLFQSIVKEKVRLKIIPKAVVSETRNTETGKKGFILADNIFSSDHGLFAFEIINKSNFPVVVDEIGLLTSNKKYRLAIFTPQLGDNGTWPRELASRKNVVVYGNLSSILELVRQNKISCAYAKTTCDSTCYGNSVALKALIKYVKSNKN